MIPKHRVITGQFTPLREKTPARLSTMSLTLEPVSIADRAAIADVIIRANFDDPYGKTVWPNSTLESRIAGSYARLANTLLGEGAWFMKCVDTSNGQIVAYAQWTLPIQLWEKFRLQHGGGVQAQVTDDMRKRFELESIESCTSEGEPRGMRIEVVEHCSPAMVPARNVAFPEDEEYISKSCILLASGRRCS